MAFLHRIYVALGSLKLTVVLLLLLTLLTFIGTLAQVEKGLFEAQRQYFESWLVLHPVRDLNVPLPGGQLVMTVLFVNLLVGGFLRMRRRWRLIGVYIAHVGIALMLVAGFVKLYHSRDGYLTLYEKDSADFFESHYHWELAISGPDGNEFVVPEQVLLQAGDRRVTLQHAALPFTATLDGYAPNVWPQPASGNRAGAEVVDGFFLEKRPRDATREAELPGAYLSLRPRQGPERRTLLLGGHMHRPTAWQTEVDGGRWTFDLRRERWRLPFTVKLEDFRKAEHPGTTMASAYESDVIQSGNGRDRAVNISMNRPLRDEGFTLFQSSWGPQTEPGSPPPSRLFSQFSVVENPSDDWPAWSCGILALGLLIHFGQRLLRHLDSLDASRA